MVNNIKKCPKCKNLMVKSKDGIMRIRTKVLLWKANGCFAVCKKCNYEIPLIDLSVNAFYISDEKLKK